MEYYNTKKVARLVKVTPATIGNWCRNSKKYLNPIGIEAHRIGRDWLILADADKISRLKKKRFEWIGRPNTNTGEGQTDDR